MPVFNQSRSNIIRLIFGGMFLVIAIRLVDLQIVSSKYKKLAQENALFPKRIYPNRGIIYDRTGKAILNNAILYDLMVTPSQVKNCDTSYFCELLGIDTAEFRERVLDARIKNGPFRPSIFEDLLAPDRYEKMAQRIKGRDEVNGIVSDFCRSMTRDELLAHCLKLEVPIGPINNVADIHADPHFRARQNFVEIVAPGEGPVTVANVIPRLSETPGEIKWLGAKFGEHNMEIYRDQLGLSEAEIAELKQTGVI